MDLTLRTEVPLEDLIEGHKYDLHISVIDRPNTMGFYTLKEDEKYDLENMTFKGKKDKAKWATKYDNNKLLFEDSDGKKTTVEGDRTYRPHPHNLNKAYRTKTLGDVLSKKNPDKEQSSAALRALTPLYDNPDMIQYIGQYGGKKKRKRKTLKRTKLTKRIRKIRSKKQRGGETNEQLYRAIEENDVNKVIHAIKLGADVNVVNGSKSAIELASHDGKLAIVKILLATGANVNRKLSGILSHPALTRASVNGHTEIVKLLLEADANPLAVSYGKITAIKLARNNGHEEIVRLINNRIISNNHLTANLVTKLLPMANRNIANKIAPYVGGKRYRRKTTKKRRSKRQSRKN